MDDDESSRFVKKKVTSGNIDAHPSENALIVSYYVQSTKLDDSGVPISTDRKAMQKTIRVKSLSTASELSELAQDIVQGCKFIHSSKVKDVEQVLYYLQQRQAGSKTAPSASDGSNRAWLRRQLEDARQQDVEVDTSSQEESPAMYLIESYIEGLYEEVPDKINATRKILQLARDPNNMDELISNDALMSALSRVLREENKKSMELVTNIFYIFFCFSGYSQFHPIITANKIGDMCLRVTDQEINRFNIWMQDLEKLERKCEYNHDNQQLVRELDQEHRKFQAMLKKQDQLLFVCFHLLLNLAEDLNIEVKMVKRDIVKYLYMMLDRKSSELLILTVTFLKKLSIFKENKDEMAKGVGALLDKLIGIIPCENPNLQNLALRFLLNLSHDQKIRSALIRTGFLNKFIDLLHSKNNLLLTLQLLYQLSIDESSRPLFANTTPLVIKMVLEYKGERVNIELMALAINISMNQQCAEQICDDNGLKFLVRRATKTRDTLILKMLRNMAMHDGSCKLMFLDHIDDLMHLLFKNLSNPEIVVEILAIIGALTIQDFDFAKLAEAYGLLDLIQNRLAMSIAESHKATSSPTQHAGRIPGISSDDDVTLQILILLGTMATDENIAPMVAKSEILQLVMDLMIAKEEDDEIILQIIYAIYQLLFHEPTRTILITETQIVSYLIDLLYDTNVQIRKMCDECLDIIAEIDEDWVLKIREQKFQWHNAEYLAVMAQSSHDGGLHDDGVDDGVDEEM